MDAAPRTLFFEAISTSLLFTSLAGMPALASAAPVPDLLPARLQLEQQSAEDGARVEADERCRRLYWLLDPMPRSCFGDLDTDRPHLTETPGVVPPGHFQLETELVNWARHRGGNLPASIGALEFLAKVGIVNRVDLEVIYQTVSFQRHRSATGVRWDTESGRDLLWRLKVNLFEAEWGDVTVAPLLTTPLRDSLGVEPGLLLLYSIELPGALDLEVNLTGFAERAGPDEWRAMLAPAAAVTRQVYGPFSAFGELYGEWRSRTDEPWSTIFATGMLYLINRDLQFDAGARFGLTDDLSPVTLFLGVSFLL